MQDAASSVMCGIIHLHNTIMCIMVYIGYIVFGYLAVNVTAHTEKNVTPKGIEHNTALEII
jgi:heme/copper-type cytochrome/quinol oxidase subunit 2